MYNNYVKQNKTVQYKVCNKVVFNFHYTCEVISFTPSLNVWQFAKLLFLKVIVSAALYRLFITNFNYFGQKCKKYAQKRIYARSKYGFNVVEITQHKL